jgi:DNA-directed RNA polymerase subunit alpha
MEKLEKSFILPQYKVAEHNNRTHTGTYVFEPLERGFGVTLGTALRRVLLSSLPGAAVFAIKVEGAKHEFSVLEGVREDLTEIILNIKSLVLKIADEYDDAMSLSVDVTNDDEGELEITAGMINAPLGVEVVNTNLVIATLAKGASLRMEMLAKKGRGFVTNEDNKQYIKGVEWIAIDSLFSPVILANPVVDQTRVGRSSKYERLTMEVETNGSIGVPEAISLASFILIQHLEVVKSVLEQSKDINAKIFMDEAEAPKEKPGENMNIEDLDLSVRSYNCLKRESINNVYELIQRTQEELSKIKNLGKKSEKEIIDKVHAKGFEFRKPGLAG